MKNPETFPHPIGLMLFNRFEYSQQVLMSLSAPTTVPFDITTVDFSASISSLRDQYRADFAKSLAEQYVIPKIRAFTAQKSFKNLPRRRRVASLLGQAFRALY